MVQIFLISKKIHFEHFFFIIDSRTLCKCWLIGQIGIMKLISTLPGKASEKKCMYVTIPKRKFGSNPPPPLAFH